MTGLAVLSTLPGVIAHVSEELQTGRRLRVVPDEMVDYHEHPHEDLASGLHDAGWSTETSKGTDEQ